MRWSRTERTFCRIFAASAADWAPLLCGGRALSLLRLVISASFWVLTVSGSPGMAPYDAVDTQQWASVPNVLA